MPEKTVLITGCTEGSLGAAMAMVYRSRGFKVFAGLRTMAKAGSLATQPGIEVVQVDVTSDESVSECAKLVEKQTGGKLDVLVNCAGIGTTMPLLDIAMPALSSMMDTNVFGMIRMVQAFSPMLIKAKEGGGGGGGIVCNISSAMAELVTAFSAPYGASKAAMTYFSECLRLELAPLGVRVCTVKLGGVDTNINDASQKGDLQLPSSSRYAKIYDNLNSQYKVEHYPDRQTAETAARNIVGDTLDTKAYFIYRGAGASMARLASSYMPYGSMINMLNKDLGLDKL